MLERPLAPATRVVRRASPAAQEQRADVCVVGAGIAGVSAALEAARLGRSVLLVDGLPALGGQAVNSIIGTFCGLFSNGPERASADARHRRRHPARSRRAGRARIIARADDITVVLRRSGAGAVGREHGARAPGITRAAGRGAARGALRRPARRRSSTAPRATATCGSRPRASSMPPATRRSPGRRGSTASEPDGADLRHADVVIEHLTRSTSPRATD